MSMMMSDGSVNPIADLSVKEVNAIYQTHPDIKIKGWSGMLLLQKQAALAALLTEQEAITTSLTEQAATVIADTLGEDEEELHETVTNTTGPVESVSDSTTNIDCLENDPIQSTVHQVENMDESTALGQVSGLVEDIELNFFVLGGVLNKIQENAWYGEHPTFKDWVSAETGLKTRKAFYLMKIYQRLAESGVVWEQVSSIGWSKLKELVSILTIENVEEWVEKAESMTVTELNAEVKAFKESSVSGEEVVPDAVKTKTFKLQGDNIDLVEAGLDKAKSESGSEFDGVALGHMATSYLNDGPPLMPVATDTLGEVVEGSNLQDMKAAVTALFLAMKDLDSEKSVIEVFDVFDAVFPEVDIEVTWISK